MREIKFRGRDDLTGNGWVYGDFSHGYYGNECLVDEIIVVEKTVGQFTGLRDADGCAIYEGDILSNGRDTVAVSYSIEFAAFVGLYNGREDLILNLDDCIDQPLDELKLKVVGNVYDNPDLLEVAHD